MKDKKYFDVLQIFRGIAAFMVVIHHVYPSFEYFHQANFPIVKLIGDIGKLGVDFFFVLSGFIISFTTFKYRNNKDYIKEYLISRFLRVYVPFLPISIALLVIYYIYPNISDSPRQISTLTSLTLIPYGEPALSVAWTLTFEILFYIIYAVNFFSVKVFKIFAVCWVGIILLGNIFSFSPQLDAISKFISPYNLEFMLGIGITYFLKSNYKTSYSVMLILIISCSLVFLFLKLLHIELFPFATNFVFSLVGVLLIITGTKYWNGKISSSNAFMLLGNMSYSLYLIHNPLQSLLVRVVPHNDSPILLFELFIVVVLICCLTSYVYYKVFEEYILRIFKDRLLKYV